MPTPLLHAAVIPLLASLAPLPAQADAAARLVPSDALIVVRTESVQAFNDLVRRFEPLLGEPTREKLAGETEHGFDLEHEFEEVCTPGSEPRAEVDKSLPFFVAVSFDPASGPVRTAILPVRQPFRLKKEILGGSEQYVQLGAYTGISTLAGYAASAEPSPLVADLRPGVVSVHVDLAALIQLYRPFIDMGLEQAEASLDQMPSDELPFDPQPLMEAYLGGARAVVDSAEALDLCVQRAGDEVALQLDFRAREGSALDGWAAGKTANLARMAGYADPAGSFQGVFSGNWGELFGRFEGLMDAVVEMYPEPLRTDMQELLELNLQLAPLLEPGLAYSFDLGGTGVRGAYVLRSSRPDEVADTLERMLRQLDHQDGFVHVGPAERLAVDGLEARVLPLTLDYGAILRMIAAAAPAGEPGAAVPDAAQLQQVMETVYGKTPRLALARHGELVAVAVANDDAYLRDALARLRASAAPGPKLQRLLDRAAPGSLAFLYHLDFGQTMGQLFESFASFMPAPALSLPADPFSLDLWGSIHERTWLGGFAMDVEELIDFVQAVQELEDQ